MIAVTWLLISITTCVFASIAPRHPCRLDRRGAVAGARHRREYGHLLARQQPAAAVAAGRRPDRLVVVNEATTTSGAASWPYAVWDHIRQRAKVFDAPSPGRQPDSIWRRRAKRNRSTASTHRPIFSPSASRRCSADDHRRRRRARRRTGWPVAVISYGFWQQHTAAPPTRSASAHGRPRAVHDRRGDASGVLRTGRRSHVRRRRAARHRTADARRRKRSIGGRSWWLNIMLRLKPGQTIDAGTARFAACSRRFVRPRCRGLACGNKTDI